MQGGQGNKTHIKFGGWDKDAIVKTDTLRMIETQTNSYWQVLMQGMKINGNVTILDLDVN